MNVIKFKKWSGQNRTSRTVSYAYGNAWEDKGKLVTKKPGFWVLCGARWTVQVLSLKSITESYEVLSKVWGDVYKVIYMIVKRAKEL